MITLDLSHLFKTNPKSNLIPRKLADWVSLREKVFPVNYQITFHKYKNEKEKNESMIYEKIFFSRTPRQVESISFPFSDGYWIVRITGSELDDGTFIPFTDQYNPKHNSSIGLRGNHRAIISGLQEYLDKKDPQLVQIPNTIVWAYKRIFSNNPYDEEMIKIRCDRNINDEWEFRGTIEEFVDKKIKPLLN